MIVFMLQTAKNFLVTRGVDFVLSVAAAIVVYLVGRWAIRGVRALARRGLEREHFDPTLAKYLDQTIGVVLTILLVVVALGVLGVQTSSLAGMLAAAGVAIGVAWAGLLSNIAAGFFIVSLRPFKRGDSVQIAGVTGEVEQIGLFGTVVLTGDGTKAIIGNAKVLGDTVHNFSTCPHRRVDARAQLPWASDPRVFYDALRTRFAAEEKILKTPPPIVETIDHNAAGPVAAIRPFCLPADYGDVVFVANRIIAEEISKAGLVAPSAAGIK
jgi:small conductance mechanosensitive channel